MNVFILEDHPLVAHGIESVLKDSFQDIRIQTESNMNNAMARIGFDNYDLAIVDLCIKGKRSFDFLEKSIENRMASKCLVFTSSIRKDYYEKAFSYNIDGYLVKECMPEDLIYAIKTVMNGRKFIDPIFYDLEKERNLNSNIGTLTSREKEILRMIGEGCTNKHIAEKTYITVNTVKKHTTNIFNKMDFESRNQAILFCQKNYV